MALSWIPPFGRNDSRLGGHIGGGEISKYTPCNSKHSSFQSNY